MNWVMGQGGSHSAYKNPHRCRPLTYLPGVLLCPQPAAGHVYETRAQISTDLTCELIWIFLRSLPQVKSKAQVKEMPRFTCTKEQVVPRALLCFQEHSAS